MHRRWCKISWSEYMQITQTTSINRFWGKIDQFGWLILLLCAPVFLFMQSRQSWLLLILPVLWLISLIAHQKVLPLTPLNGILLLFSVQILISLYATYDISISLPKISSLVFSIALFFALVKFSSGKKSILVTVLLFGIAGSAIAVLGFFGTSWATAKISAFNPIYALLPSLSRLLPGLSAGFHPNEVAGVLGWVLPIWIIAAGWLIARAKIIHKTLKWFPHLLLILMGLISSLLIGGVIFLTQSRSAYLGVLFSLVLIMVFALPRKWRWVFLVAVVAGVVLVVFFDAIPLFFNWLSNLFPTSNLSINAYSFDTLNGRTKIWSRAIIAIQDFSFTGMGMNTFRYLVHQLYPLSPVIPNITPKDLGHAHNEILQSALDLGIPGMIAFLALNLSAIWMSVTTILKLQKSSRRTLNNQTILMREFYQIVSIGLLAGFIGHFIYAITDAISLGAKPGFVFWILLSLVTSIYMKTKRREFN